MSESFPLTFAGKQLLEEELKKLITVDRPAVIKAIEIAREHGDLSENADYDAAKDRQAFIEARIGEIQNQLANAQVIDTANIVSEKIVFGAKVRLLDMDTDSEIQYQIVGVPEASVETGKISVNSPIARGLIGKLEGDEVEVKAPGGLKTFEILSIEYS
ncbi:MAG: transcription elongation factor GreA [Bdellovibrionales bacterium]